MIKMIVLKLHLMILMKQDHLLGMLDKWPWGNQSLMYKN